MTFEDDSQQHNQTHAANREDAAFSKHGLTVGERLAAEARARVSRQLPQFLWLRPLNTTRKHLEALPVPDHSRFQRTEVAPSAVTARPLAPAAPENQPSVPQTMPPMWPPQPYQRVQAQEQQGQPLPTALQQRIETVVGEQVRHVQIHADDAADEFAQARRADAVTIGQHIFFRRGRFRPHEDEGLALLTHEAMHVVQAMRPNASWQRATSRGIQEQEQEALTHERRALAPGRVELGSSPFPLQPPTQAAFFQSAVPPLPTLSQSAVPPLPALSPTSAPSSSPVQHPMTASIDRAFEPQAMPEQLRAGSENPQRSLAHELMRQMRIDQERGG